MGIRCDHDKSLTVVVDSIVATTTVVFDKLMCYIAMHHVDTQLIDAADNARQTQPTGHQ